jgi:hypothetical protein
VSTGCARGSKLGRPSTSLIRLEEPPANQTDTPNAPHLSLLSRKTKTKQHQQTPTENPRSSHSLDPQFFVHAPAPPPPTTPLRHPLTGAAPTPTPPRRRLYPRVRQDLRPALLPVTRRRRRRYGRTAPAGPSRTMSRPWRRCSSAESSAATGRPTPRSPPSKTADRRRHPPRRPPDPPDHHDASPKGAVFFIFYCLL